MFTLFTLIRILIHYFYCISLLFTPLPSVHSFYSCSYGYHYFYCIWLLVAFCATSWCSLFLLLLTRFQSFYYWSPCLSCSIFLIYCCSLLFTLALTIYTHLHYCSHLFIRVTSSNIILSWGFPCHIKEKGLVILLICLYLAVHRELYRTLHILYVADTIPPSVHYTYT